MHRRTFLAAVAAQSAIGDLAWASESDVSGAGASFPAKVYLKWARHYSETTGVTIGYSPSGSTNGVKQIAARAVDFGASDVPLTADKLAQQGLFQFPTLVGGVVPVANLPGIPSGALRLDGDTLGRIFNGRITRWSDGAIAALNPGLPLPDIRIVRIVREDGSGTTQVLADYLNRFETAMPFVVHQGRVNWRGKTLGADGSSKLVASVKATNGAIGYASSDYVLAEDLVAITLRNKRGQWVRPSVDAFGAAIREGALFKRDLAPSPLIDLDGVSVWPIVTATYILVPRAPTDLLRAARVLNFFYRSFLLGDKAVAGTGFAPLPSHTQAHIVALLANFRTTTGQAVPAIG